MFRSRQGGSGTGAFILKLRFKAIAELFDYVLIDVQPSGSQLCLTAVGASDYVVIPVEANVKGISDALERLRNRNRPTVPTRDASLISTAPATPVPPNTISFDISTSRHPDSQVSQPTESQPTESQPAESQPQDPQVSGTWHQSRGADRSAV